MRTGVEEPFDSPNSDVANCAITKADVQAFMGKLVETLAPDTARTVRRYLSKILSTVMEWSYVDQNVTRGIRLPAPRRRKHHF